MVSDPGRSRELLKYMISPFLGDFARYIQRQVTFLLNRKILRRNQAWRNRYLNDEVVVVGNGPSLRQLDHAYLMNKKVIVMNNFYRGAWAKKIRPVATCFGEPPNSSAWEDPTVIFEMTPSDSYWLHFDNIKKGGPLNFDERFNYVLPGIGPRLFRQSEVRLDRLSLSYENTGILAIEIALYMGFKLITLVGFDHDWLASPEFSRHFYSDQKDATDMIGRLSYLNLINSAGRTWQGYYALDRASKSHGARIVNCSTHSFLDVFERAMLNSPSRARLEANQQD